MRNIIFFRFFQDSPSDGNVSLLDFFIFGVGASLEDGDELLLD